MTTTLIKTARTIPLTKEQLVIVDSVHDDSTNIHIVDAFAGSGKTHTIVSTILAAKKHNPRASVRVLMYSKTLVGETRKKLDEVGLTEKKGVYCSTLHSFALRRVNEEREKQCLPKLKVIKNISDIITKIKEENEQFKFVSSSCVSSIFKAYNTTELYKSVEGFCNHVENSEHLLAKFHVTTKRKDNVKNTLELFKVLYKYFTDNNLTTHDMYLKDYAFLYRDEIVLDYLFIDEAQDLDIFMTNILQRVVCKKIYFLGDPAQQINQFRGVVDIMNCYKNIGRHYGLTISHRLNEQACTLCNAVLYLDKDFREKDFRIMPGHNNTKTPRNPVTVVMQRSKLGIVREVAKHLHYHPSGYVKIMSGGNAVTFNSLIGNKLEFMCFLLEHSPYAYAKEALLKAFPYVNPPEKLTAFQKESLEKAKENKESIISYYASIGDDTEKKACSLILNYINKNTLDEEQMISDLKATEKALTRRIPQGTPNSEIFTISTVHSSKGLEYDRIVIGEDFWNLDTREGQNLAYVALSRGKYETAAKELIREIESYLPLVEKYDWSVTEYGSACFFRHIEYLFKCKFNRYPTKRECNTLAMYAYSKLHNMLKIRKQEQLALQVKASKKDRTFIARNYIDACINYIIDKHQKEQISSSYLDDINEFITKMENKEIEIKEVCDKSIEENDELCNIPEEYDI